MADKDPAENAAATPDAQSGTPKPEAAKGARSQKARDDAATPDQEPASPDTDETAGGTDRESELSEALAAAEAAAREYQDQLLRTRAEAENQRRRLERQSATALKYASERVFRDLLAVADSLELGLDAARKAGADQAVLEGLELTRKQLHDVFTQHGVSVVDPAGAPFDPERHEAVSMVPSPQVAPNHVLDVVQKGYLLHERVLRAARVVVAAQPPAGEGGPADAENASGDAAKGPSGGAPEPTSGQG